MAHQDNVTLVGSCCHAKVFLGFESSSPRLGQSFGSQETQRPPAGKSPVSGYLRQKFAAARGFALHLGGRPRHLLLSAGLAMSCNTEPPAEAVLVEPPAATSAPAVSPASPQGPVGPPEAALPNHWVLSRIIKLNTHADAITAVGMSSDGKTAVTGSADLTARIWDLTSGQQRWRLTGHTQALTAVAISDNGASVLTASLDRTVRVWNANTGKALRAWHGQARRVSALALSPSGKYAASGDHAGLIHVWDMKTGKLERRFVAHARPINQLKFSADEKKLLSASDDKTAVLWDWRAAKPLVKCPGHSGWVTSAALTRDGSLIVTGSADKTVRLWSTRDGSLVRVLKDPIGPISQVLADASGTLVIGAGGALGFASTVGPQDFSVRIWDAATGRQSGQLVGHAGPVVALTSLPDGSLLTASLDETVRLWTVHPAP